MLPFVLLALVAASLLSLAFAGDALHALQSVRAAVAGADAGAQADAALASALASWEQDSIWTIAPGGRAQRNVAVAGVPVRIEWHRQQPLVATVRATRQRPSVRRQDLILRDHWRAIWLDPPRLPIVGALVTPGSVAGSEGSLISGSDVALPTGPCGGGRDTMSVPPVVAFAVRGQEPGSWPGAPLAQHPSSSLAEELAAALQVVAERAPAVLWDSTPQRLSDAAGWQALRIRAERAGIDGPSQWQGLLVVHGDLTVRGRLELEGVLVVEGRVDASAGELLVQGAVIAADTSAKAVMLGAQSRLFYDRCSVQMALATLSRPTVAPFLLWQNLPH